MTQTAYPYDEVPTPTLELWETNGAVDLDPAWGTWAAPDHKGPYRVQVEVVDLELPSESATRSGFEVRLERYEPRPVETLVRETVGNAHAALGLANFLAANTARFDDGDWHDDLTPRPEEVGSHEL